MYQDMICGKDVAEILFRNYELDLSRFTEVETPLCECGEHKAKYKLVDEFNNKMNLCECCLKEMKDEYKEEGTTYKVSLIK